MRVEERGRRRRGEDVGMKERTKDQERDSGNQNK